MSHIPLKFQESSVSGVWIYPTASSRVSPKVPSLGLHFTCLSFLLPILSVFSTRRNAVVSYVMFSFLMSDYGCVFILSDQSKVDKLIITLENKKL